MYRRHAGTGEFMSKKKLYKSTRDKKLAGICGGLAEYLNMDSTVVRLIFVLLFIFWGTSLLVYIILALVMPDDTEIIQ